jgi:hypothetical protein
MLTIDCAHVVIKFRVWTAAVSIELERESPRCCRVADVFFFFWNDRGSVDLSASICAHQYVVSVPCSARTLQLSTDECSLLRCNDTLTQVYMKA